MRIREAPNGSWTVVHTFTVQTFGNVLNLLPANPMRWGLSYFETPNATGLYLSVAQPIFVVPAGIRELNQFSFGANTLRGGTLTYSDIGEAITRPVWGFYPIQHELTITEFVSNCDPMPSKWRKLGYRTTITRGVSNSDGVLTIPRMILPPNQDRLAAGTNGQTANIIRNAARIEDASFVFQTSSFLMSYFAYYEDLGPAIRGPIHVSQTLDNSTLGGGIAYEIVGVR